MTLLAVPIAAPTLEAAEQMIRRAEQGGAELLELRLDLLPLGAAEKLPRLANVPVLATCRDKAEGGRGSKSADGDVARARELAAAVAAGAAFVDFEFAAWERSAEARRILEEATRRTFDATQKALNAKQNTPNAERGAPGDMRPCQLVLSAHNFAGRIPEVGRLLERLWKSPADIVKVAYKADRITDSFDALDILHAARHHKPTIALAMGEAGVITRLLAKKFGAFCTFAAIDAGQGTAPGQPTLAEFKMLYRWDRVGPATELFGVIGHPIAHSMSPAIHNTAFDATDYDGLYLPLLVEPVVATFDELLDGIGQRNRWLGFRGLSVTLPHKENALRYLRERGGQIEPLAERIGAINTIRFEADGSLSGRNTDYAAALDAVCDGLGCTRAGLAGRTVAVLGAGGVARAIVAGFVDAGSRVTIYNRTADRGEKLAAEFGCHAEPLTDESSPDAQVIVNATSVGMSPNIGHLPLPGGAIWTNQLVFDTVYNPVRTELLRQAEQAGARTVDGVAMFVRQAVAQFEWWTGRAAPVELMRKVVLDRLAGKSQ